MAGVVLASASPRRRDLLARVVWPYTIRPADLDETALPGENPRAHVERLAREKACAVSREHPGEWVLGADTVVVLGDRILGKPGDERAASAMLSALQGRTHEVLTGVSWVRDGSVRASGVASSNVRFRPMTDAEIAAYAATTEPLDKAGAYALQGRGGAFVAGVEGEISNVIGLPLEFTARLSRAAGVPMPEGELPPEAVAPRWRAVRDEICGLAVASGRTPGDVRLVAVSKGQSDARVNAATLAGAADLGENYVREGEARRARCDPEHRLRWHLIGPLQTNKSGGAARAFDLIHTIDREAVAEALLRAAEGPLEVLVQVNVAGDAAKAGVTPGDLPGLVERLRQRPGLSLRGLMTIGRAGAPPAETRQTFVALRELRDCLCECGLGPLPELSMGMSGDYALAVAEGATLVRIGTAIFGRRGAGRRAESAEG